MEHQQTWGEGSVVTAQGIVHHGIQTTMRVDIHVIKRHGPQGRIHESGAKDVTY